MYLSQFALKQRDLGFKGHYSLLILLVKGMGAGNVAFSEHMSFFSLLMFCL